MPTILKFRRGTTEENNALTLENGELFIDTDKNTVVVHNGSTSGGQPLVSIPNQLINDGDSIVYINEGWKIKPKYQKWYSDAETSEIVYDLPSIQVNATRLSISTSAAEPISFTGYIFSNSVTGFNLANTSLKLQFIIDVEPTWWATTFGDITFVSATINNNFGQVITTYTSDIVITDTSTNVNSWGDGTLIINSLFDDDLKNELDLINIIPPLWDLYGTGSSFTSTATNVSAYTLV